MPYEDISWNCDDQSCIYLETMNPVEVKCLKFRHRLINNYVLIGKKFSLYNYSASIVYVRGFIIRMENSIKRSLIIRESLDDSYISELISELFRPQSIMNDIVSKLEVNFPKYYRKLCKEESSASGKKAHQETLAGNIDSRLLIINRYIRSNYEKPLTLQQLSEIIQCNPIYLSNTYSRVFKISPMKYCLDLKMKKAKELVLQTSSNINVIAKNLGYVSSSQFANLFKKYYNVTPTEMRAKIIKFEGI
ncbi:hypothetical protein ET33_30875 [Paenibacillus tyrfis]|uniref:HTH araC/xylS-type domain-containing protein n=2 Tax=Paenibacillus tyrfis TaxID=1501230 RepID=A0A081NTP1_9BACL|nr:hypothetical protein ET33_30875 [Paenibacillus tyrfis]